MGGEWEEVWELGWFLRKIKKTFHAQYIHTHNNPLPYSKAVLDVMGSDDIGGYPQISKYLHIQVKT